MSLPLDVNPLSWTYGVPFLLSFVCLYFAPVRNPVKAALVKLHYWESGLLANMFTLRIDYCEQKAHRRAQRMLLAVMLFVGLLSAASFGAWLGIV